MKEPAITPLILLADDDPDDWLLVQDAANECGWDGEVRHVANGEELLDYLWRRGQYAEPGSSPRPGLVLLDLNMPRKDGREALRELKAEPNLRRIPVVVLQPEGAREKVAM